MKTTFAIVLMMMPVVTPQAADDEPPTLRNNPFSRPPSEVIANVTNPISPVPTSTEPLELQATMIGTVTKLANVGGKIIKQGDEVQGYVLVAIHERYAVFARNGEETTVYVKPVQSEDKPSSGRRR